MLRPFRFACFALTALTFATEMVAEGNGGNELRELTTDRPDVTESPFTINPGNVQLEMSLVDFTTDRADGLRTNAWQFAPLNLRFGISESTELGVFLTPHVLVEDRGPGTTRSRRHGFSDVVLRGKLNFFGNDGKGTALGLVADLKLPTAAGDLGNNRVEGTVLLPIALELGAGWDGGAMTGLELVYADTGNYRPVWINTVTFGHSLTAKVDGYVEVTSAAGDGAHVATLDCGVTRKLNERTQLDAGINIGLSAAAADLEVFTGISYRW